MYIYIITNQVNGKKYVGQSVNDPDASRGRVRLHLNLRTPNCDAIHKAVKKYGKENFTYKML